MSSEVHRSPVRIIEVSVVESKTSVPYALVSLATTIETARYLSRFMTGPDVPSKWFEVKEIPAPGQLRFPFIADELAEHPEAKAETIEVPIED